MELLSADVRLRRMVLSAFIAAVGLGGVALWALRSWLGGAAAGSIAGSHLLVAFLCISGISVLTLAALGVYLWRYGARVRAASQYPPPGARVIRDTPILRGAAASRRGVALQGVAVALVLCAAGLALAAWRFYSLFSAHAA